MYIITFFLLAVIVFISFKLKYYERLIKVLNLEMLDSDHSSESQTVSSSKKSLQIVKQNNEKLYLQKLIPFEGRVISVQSDVSDLKDLICDDEMLLANLSHELRSPLVSILGYSNILLDSKASPAEKEFAASVINRNCMTQLNMLESLIDFSRLSSKGATLNKSVFLFREIVEQLRDEYKFKIEEKGIDFIIHNGQKNFIEADKHRLYQVFNNLLSNALKFTEEGKIEVDIRYKDDKLIVKVRDTGIGIEDTSDIFKPFSQLVHRENGLGLGLHVCKRVVDLHEGSIDVVSDSSGTEFKVELPIGNLRKRILLLEDDPVVAGETTTLLDSYEVDLALTCEEFLNKISAKNYDLIICDLYLPDGTAFDVLNKVDRNVPLIALTSAVGMKEKALKIGFNFFMMKPVDKAKLNKEVKRLLDK